MPDHRLIQLIGKASFSSSSEKHEAIALAMEIIDANEPLPGVYFMQDTRQHVGNCPMFWKHPGGYTSNIKEARVWTRDQAMAQHRARDTDLPWLASEIWALRRLTIDAQYLPRTHAQQAEFLNQPPKGNP